jgi:hypothetical protein
VAIAIIPENLNLISTDLLCSTAIVRKTYVRIKTHQWAKFLPLGMMFLGLLINVAGQKTGDTGKGSKRWASDD